jgi:hypothetical protein
MRTHNRRFRRRLASYRRRVARTLAAALIAGGALAAAQTAGAAAIGWDPGIGSVSYDIAALETGVEVDIDGDGFADFALDGSACGYGCSYIELTPLTVNSINNEVFTDGSQIAVRDFANPDDVLAAALGGDTTSTGLTALWVDQDITAFQSRAIAGLLFEIPGGSPYVGYVDLLVYKDFDLEYLYIYESGYQLIPEPGSGILLGTGGLLGLGLLGRRRARSKRAS